MNAAQKLSESALSNAPRKKTLRKRRGQLAIARPKKGGILGALRRSPLVGADLDLARSHDTGRKVDL